MLISAVLATAKTVRNGKIVSIGKSGAPSLDHLEQRPALGLVDPLQLAGGQHRDTEIATSM